MLPVFRYTTLAEVKGRIAPELLTGTGGLTDAEILRQIEAASAAINAWTRQVFQPYPETVQVSGRGDALIQHPGVLPVIELAEASMDENRTTGQFKEMDRIIPGMRNFPERHIGARYGASVQQNYASFIQAQGGGKVAWNRGERLVSLVTLIGGFTKGIRNVALTGWFGWLEQYKRVRMTLGTAIPILTAATSLHVNNVVDILGEMLEEGDTIAITVVAGTKVPQQIELAVVQSIAVRVGGGFTLTIDAMHKFPVAIPVGAEIVCWGRVPNALRDVANYVAAHDSSRIYAERTGDSAAVAAFEGTLKSEKTDNYSYTLGGASGGAESGSGTLGRYTGSAKMDLLLRQFSKPSAAIVIL